jgi:hypothetical protein
MSSVRRVLSVLTGLTVVITACDQAKEAVAPEPAGTVTFNAVRGPTSASGHAELHGVLPTPIMVQRISFGAVSTGDGVLARGQVEVQASRWIGADFVVHADVTCLSISGNQAWIGAVITHFDVKDLAATPPPFVGTPVVFVVKDNGEGEGVIDEAALVFFAGVPGADIGHCNERPVLTGLRALRPSTHGNIRVAGGEDAN